MKAFWFFGCDWFCCRCSKATVKGPQTLLRRISTTCSVTTTIPARSVAVPPGRIEFWWGGSPSFTTNHNVSTASYLAGIGHIDYESTCIKQSTHIELTCIELWLVLIIFWSIELIMHWYYTLCTPPRMYWIIFSGALKFNTSCIDWYLGFFVHCTLLNFNVEWGVY